MKKLIVVFLVLFVSINLMAEDIEPFTVSIWVSSDNPTMNTRIYNELILQLESSDEFYFAIEKEDTDSADFHLVIRGIDLEDGRYAWGVSSCPLHDPTFNDGAVYWSEASIAGANWLAREIPEFLEGMIYLMYDYYQSSGAFEEENSFPHSS